MKKKDLTSILASAGIWGGIAVFIVGCSQYYNQNENSSRENDNNSENANYNDNVEDLDSSVYTTREECEANNGIWKQWGLNPEERCNLRTSDAGKVCYDSKECKGNCLTDHCGDFAGENSNNDYIKCLQKTPDDAVCIALFDPVCGEDGRTYSNTCEACREVEFYKNGSCDLAGGVDKNGFCSEFQTTFGCFYELYGGECYHICVD